MSERLGDRVAAARRDRGLTQRELAQLAGVALGTVRDLEQGRTRRPDASVVRRLSAVLGAVREPVPGVPSGNRWSGLISAPRLSIEVLGPLRVTVAGQPRPVEADRLRTLLTLLALGAGWPVETETIVSALWGERPPETAANLIQTYVSRLRRLLGSSRTTQPWDALLVRSAQGYRLAVSPPELDLLRFQQHLQEARGAAAQDGQSRALAGYRAALAVWSGDVAADVPALRGHPRVVRLHRERLSATVEYASLAMAMGAHRQALPVLEAAAEAEPLHDGVHAQLILALGGTGDRARAMRVFELFRQRIAEELGVSPDRAVLDAYRQVLDVALSATSAADISESDAGPEPAPGRVPVEPAGGVLPVPRQLPADTVDFTGRADLLHQLDTVLGEAGTNLVAVLSGSAGVGKTVLATHWAHRAAARFPDGQLHTNLRGYATGDPMHPLAVLALFLRALGIPPQHVPSDVDEAASLYRSVLADRRVLVVLDNAASPEQVRPLLPGSQRCRVLITSRDRLVGLVAREAAASVHVDVLAEAEALHLLARVAGTGVAAEPAAAAQLVRLCARLPLALRIAGTNISEDPHLSVSGYVHRLTVGNLLDELALEDEPGTAVSAAFELSYRGLDPFPRRMFGLLGAAPGPS
ncbi:BTAD domain-containing putative transcriptional regulator [Rhizomonospora bruguierae]|uniref:BTAD domain-containing putative transcriptional regulator n=1 Tax=Rhizomonospora bruguierae TaxID=1581705 RepID=UPI001BCAA4EB|nr:BTAD domain-containing putative transcriptional regulator [Micromonospora sp. NBRC 107566]